MDFFLRYKKIFLVIGFILLVILLGYLLYVMFFRPAITPPVEPPTATTTAGGLPISGVGTGQTGGKTGTSTLPVGVVIPTEGPSETALGGLTQTTKLNEDNSMGVTTSSNGNDLQYYNRNDGKFYRIDKDGNTTALSDKIFYQVENITWSPNKNKAILEYPDGANIIYNFDTGKQITMPEHWEDFDFSPDGEQIVLKSMGLDPDNRWLAMANEEGSNVHPIESIGLNADKVISSWSPNGQSIAMYVEGIDFDRQEVFFVGQNNENFKSTIVEGRDFRPLWSPEGDKLLYSVYSSKNEMKPNLWVVNAEGESIGSNRKNLNIETWADKCAFSNDTELYCAVPNSLEEGSGLFPELAASTIDRLYKIDTRTGLKKLVAVPDGEYNMSDVIVSENGYYLYFTDKSDGTLHKINLK